MSDSSNSSSLTPGIGSGRLSNSRPTDEEVARAIAERKAEVRALLEAASLRKMLAEEAVKASATVLEAAEKAADLQALKEQDEELQEMEASLVLANAATKLTEDNQAKMSLPAGRQFVGKRYARGGYESSVRCGREEIFQLQRIRVSDDTT